MVKSKFIKIFLLLASAVENQKNKWHYIWQARQLCARMSYRKNAFTICSETEKEMQFQTTFLVRLTNVIPTKLLTFSNLSKTSYCVSKSIDWQRVVFSIRRDAWTMYEIPKFAPKPILIRMPFRQSAVSYTESAGYNNGPRTDLYKKKNHAGAYENVR